ncbi:hypothetical protein [Streptomyces sp. Sge12]|uniref:hypothetical protein n=1 Tax=Streptomyces sp. Sge12 TaxID=1972846 RepID=UPI00193BD895|nr:hypothetical protein [Streptomyces sp. Sge12]
MTPTDRSPTFCCSPPAARTSPPSNAGARAALVASGELEAGHIYAVAGGGRIQFAAGDLVHIRRNDYRSRRDESAVDVLNGFRGVVLDVDAKQGVLVQWHRPRLASGFVMSEAWMSARDIAEGRLTHAYAMTIGSAQGLTAEVAVAYGLHADSHSLYPAMSRARQESHLHLPLDELEDHPTRAALEPVRTDADRLDRAIAAYGRILQANAEDTMVTDELTGIPAFPDRGQGRIRLHPVAAAPVRALALTAPGRPGCGGERGRAARRAPGRRARGPGR